MSDHFFAGLCTNKKLFIVQFLLLHRIGIFRSMDLVSSCYLNNEEVIIHPCSLVTERPPSLAGGK